MARVWSLLGWSKAGLLGAVLLASLALAGCGAPRSLGVTDAIAAAASAQADTYIGVPYVLGGQDRNGVDCSGLVVAAYRAVLPGLMFGQPDGSLADDAGALTLFMYDTDPVPLVKAKPGDLLFMDSDLDGVVDHVALFESLTGDRVSYVHATASAGLVKVTTRSVSDDWWGMAFRGAGRLRVAY